MPIFSNTSLRYFYQIKKNQILKIICALSKIQYNEISLNNREMYTIKNKTLCLYLIPPQISTFSTVSVLNDWVQSPL